VYRHYAPAYGPLNGEGARRLGGRWNPPDSYATLYTASDTETVDAEFDRMLALLRLRPESARPRNLVAIKIRLNRVIDLRIPSVRDALGVTVNDLIDDDLSVPRAISEAAQHLGFEAIIAPSAAGKGHVVAIFLTNRSPDSELEVDETRPYLRANHQ
jgi:RES domain-containing protein